MGILKGDIVYFVIPVELADHFERANLTAARSRVQKISFYPEQLQTNT
jgi:hypothetical protein